ncbi:MAG: hypothetical protein AAGD07_14785 [Planctomycetota bacterium]
MHQHSLLRSVVAAALCLACPLAHPVQAETDAKAAAQIPVFDKGTMEVPAAFKQVAPKSRIIQHEFEVKAESGEGTARLTMMAASGGIEANIQRWKGQFGGDAKKVGETKKFQSGPFDCYVIDVTGSYAERMGGGPFFGGKTVQRENYAMLGAILATEDGRTFFVKLIGPADAVKPNEEAFVEMIKSVDD